MPGRYMSAKTVKNEYDLTRQTLWNWEKKGLLQPAKTPGGQRRYSEQEIRGLLGLNESESSAKSQSNRYKDVAEEATRRIVNSGENHVDKVFLYGSTARGEEHSGSDIDLLVVMDTPEDDRWSWQKQFYKHLEVLIAESEIYISVQVYTARQWARQRGTAYFKEVTEDGIRLFSRESSQGGMGTVHG